MIEQEAKLIAPEDLQLPDLDGLVKGATAVPRPVLRLDAAYYDTPELHLIRWGITLRYRSGEPGPPWTLKLPEGEAGPALLRRELRFDGDPDVVPDSARDLVRAYVRKRPLTPVARLSTTRTPIVICGRDGERLGEIVDDVVSVYEGGRCTGRFREIEIEIATGTDRRIARKLLRAAVARLEEAGCEAKPPIPKLVRALGARAAAPPDVVVPELDDDASVRLLIRHAVASCVVQLLRHDPGVRLGEDPEDVHQFRVGARKLRSELRSFRPLLDDEKVGWLRAELKWLGDAVGAVRDSDVLGDWLRSQSQTLPAPDTPAAAELLTHLAQQAKEARTAMLAALRADRYDQLLESLIGAAAEPLFAAEPPGLPDQPARRVIVPLVRRSWRRLAAAVKALDDNPSDEALHRIRILAKHCRYTAEAFAPVIGRPAKRFADAIAEVQSILGEHQDSVVAESWLRDAAAAVPRACVAAGQLVGFLRAQRTNLRAAWPRTWKAASARKLRAWL